MNLLRRSLLKALGTALSLFTATALLAAEPKEGKEPKEPIEIHLSPRVGRIQDVDGSVNAIGTPIIFVKSGKSQEPWWVQPLPTPVGPKQFKVRLIFGNEKSVPGSQFHVVAMLLPKTARLQDFRVGTQHNFLPEYPQSNRLIVTLLGGNQSPGVEVVKSAGEDVADVNKAMPEENEPMKLSSDDVASITLPTMDSQVKRVTDIGGDLAPGHHPVILVRPLTKESTWWIQNRPTVNKDGSFKGKIVLGSEKTPEGTRFQLVVLAFEDEADANQLKVGGTLKQLPDGVKTSNEVTITYRNTKVGDVKKAPVPKTAEVVKEKS